MKKVFCFLVLAMSLYSCYNDDEIRIGEAIVSEKAYVPATNGSGVGITTGGHAAVMSMNTYERYILVFQSEWDGVFTIDDKDLWGKYSRGDVVKFEYTITKYNRVRLWRKIDGIGYMVNL